MGQDFLDIQYSLYSLDSRYATDNMSLGENDTYILHGTYTIDGSTEQVTHVWTHVI